MGERNNFGNGISGGLANAVPLRNPDTLDQLRDAQNDFHSACHREAEAVAARWEAEKRLKSISEEVLKLIDCAMLNPTQPQPVRQQAVNSAQQQAMNSLANS